MTIWDMENLCKMKNIMDIFHKTNGNEYVIGDIHKLREMTQKKYPDKPYFMLGHSMGSFLIRQYMEMHCTRDLYK